MKRSIPPHIAWPAFVVLILCIGIGGAFSALFAAGSDGGAQVIDGYYEQAVAWNEIAAERAHTNALAWRTELRVQPSAPGAPLYTIEIVIADSSEHPVAGLTGTVRLLRPHQAKPVAEIPFRPVENVPGAYRLQAPMTGSGLWDFELTARTGSDVYHTTIRKDVNL